MNTVITYDTLGRKIAMDDPDMGHWEYEYDALDRVLARRHDGQALATYTYDQGVNGVGRLARMDDPSGWTAYSYDAQGQTTRQVKHIEGAGTFTTLWAYDPMGRLAATTYPSGEVVTNTYQVNSLEAVGGYVTGIAHNVTGQPLLVGLGNGATTAYTYRPCDGRLVDLETRRGDESLMHLTYSYDLVGNVTAIFDPVLNDMQTFVYDPLDRLVEAAATGAHPYSQSFRYDVLGNITAWAAQPTPTATRRTSTRRRRRGPTATVGAQRRCAPTVPLVSAWRCALTTASQRRYTMSTATTWGQRAW